MRRQAPVSGPSGVFLQFQDNRSPLPVGPNSPLRRGQGLSEQMNPDGGPIRHGRGADNPLDVPLRPELAEAPDSMERLMKRLNAETIPVRTPHDLADAIRHIDARIPRTAAPAEGATNIEPAAKTERPDANQSELAASPTGDEDPVEVLMRLRD